MDVGRKLIPDQADYRLQHFGGAVTFQIHEIAAGFVRNDFFTAVDPVRIQDNIAGFSLAEDAGQLYRIHNTGRDDVVEYVSWPDGGQLVGIADQNQSCSGNDGF